jgi:hypothetical protein
LQQIPLTLRFIEELASEDETSGLGGSGGTSELSDTVKQYCMDFLAIAKKYYIDCLRTTKIAYMINDGESYSLSSNALKGMLTSFIEGSKEFFKEKVSVILNFKRDQQKRHGPGTVGDHLEEDNRFESEVQDLLMREILPAVQSLIKGLQEYGYRTCYNGQTDTRSFMGEKYTIMDDSMKISNPMLSEEGSTEQMGRMVSNSMFLGDDAPCKILPVLRLC